MKYSIADIKRIKDKKFNSHREVKAYIDSAPKLYRVEGNKYRLFEEDIQDIKKWQNEYAKTQQAAKKALDAYLQKHDLTKKDLEREINKYLITEDALFAGCMLSSALLWGFGAITINDVAGDTATEESRPILWALTAGIAVVTIALYKLAKPMEPRNPEQRAFISKLSDKYHKNRLAQNRALYAQKVK